MRMQEPPSTNLPEFLNSLEDFVPTIPDEFTEQSLERCGVDCNDKRIVRLVSLAAQRFVASALHDAKQVYSRRQKQTPARLKEAGYDVKDRRPVLLTEDLAEAMLEYGLTLKRPPYYADASSSQLPGK
ncbi:hypothetical protein COCSUDRAFT_68050 [Coccomyxa subellipsoidea C-169]|uniref:Transcription initiation factor TFIID subunit 10 n=1 Tax=Coccomyxa subellipsoidea (strain C-169) TaxID=574566 RepID=I0YKC9_COCSC|nr:hypothetical protein COCSUDRAFT_68050 [Coccomyxa subellipsoidea C-169]EIE18848.1 hypothetical protein COCSUDRAFT_68050 [Coccomyxa subellipsoidea C-169]|eukprot:XP_005643392.1 hypothetical protein COCSUDRAFT_68050 [Coccomyxa subellipsoidea C-169]